MFSVILMVIFVCFYNLLFFGPNMKDIYNVIQELKYDKLSLTIEENLSTFHGMYLIIDRKTKRVKLT